MNNNAFIHPDAKIGKNVTVAPFAYIDEDVVIGDNTYVGPHATILKKTRIGENCRIFPGAVIGAEPQDLKFHGEDSYVVIGNNTTIRECVTIHRGTASRGKTVVGDNCLIMAYCHVAHDCVLGNNIIMSNATQLAGEVEVSDFAVVGGGTLVHQFTKIGCHVMIQGGTKLNKDVPPYVIAAHEPVAYFGINSVGLRRRGFSNEAIASIQEIYRQIFLSELNVKAALEKIVAEVPQSPERDAIVDFIKSSERGIIKGH